MSEEINDANRELAQLAGDVASELIALGGVGPEVAREIYVLIPSTSAETGQISP